MVRTRGEEKNKPQLHLSPSSAYVPLALACCRLAPRFGGSYHGQAHSRCSLFLLDSGGLWSDRAAGDTSFLFLTVWISGSCFSELTPAAILFWESWVCVRWLLSQQQQQAASSSSAFPPIIKQVHLCASDGQMQVSTRSAQLTAAAYPTVFFICTDLKEL